MSNESALQTRRRWFSPRISLIGAAILATTAAATPARADFFDDVRRTFQKDIPRTFEEDIPRFFGADPKKPSKPPNQDKAVKQPSAEPRR